MRIVQFVNMDRFRLELKAAREGRSALRRGERLGRPGLSKRTKTDQGTAVNSQTIKNIEDGLIADPGLVTVARIVEAMGLTLSQFFAQIEGLPAASPQSTTEEPAKGATQHDGRTVPAASATIRHELSVVCLAAAKDSRRASVQALLYELAYAFAGGKAPEDRADPAARTGSD